MFYVNYSFNLLLFCVCIFVLMLLISKPYKTYLNPSSNNVKKNIVFFFFLYTINAVFAFWAEDTYHMWDDFIYAQRFVNFELMSYESIYNWLATICGNDYYLWRIMIWLPACYFFFLIAKQLNLLHRNLLLTVILFAGTQSFTRGMLGHVLLLLGAVLFLSKNKYTYLNFVGFLVFCASYFFHKSMYVNILFALLALYPFDKKYIKLSLMLFPFFSLLVTLLVDKIASGAINIALGEGVGGAGDATSQYVIDERSQSNITGMVMKFIFYLPEYLTVAYLVNRVLYKGYFRGLKQERIFTYLFRLTYIAIYIASLFYFVQTSSWIYIRFKYMAFFPLPFVLAKVWSLETKTNKWIKWIIVLQIFSFFLSWFIKLLNWYEM